jgi:hypothetical protein
VRRTNEQYAREQHEAEQHAKDVEMFARARMRVNQRQQDHAATAASR